MPNTRPTPHVGAKLNRVTRFVLAAVVGAAAATTGCVGQVGVVDEATGSSSGNRSTKPGVTSSSNPATPSIGSADTAFSCDPGAQPAPDTLRRLTMTQYRNTVSGLASWALGSAAAGTTVMTELADALRTLPVDRREAVSQDLHGSYRRLDQSLQQDHVDGFYHVGVALAQALTTSSRLATVVGKCATDSDTSNDASCLDAFITRFGSKTLRRPLFDDETKFYKSVYGTDTKATSQGYADLIAVMLNAPQFIYMVEHGDLQVDGKSGVYQLSAFELASRLSYQFWQTAPDDELVTAAGNGSLLNEDILSRQVERLYADPRTQTTIGEFASDWLKVEEAPALDAHNDDATFRAFAGTDLPEATLRQDMVDDVLGMVDYYIWKQPGSLGDLLTSKLAFHKSAKLGKIYGQDAWNGTSTPPTFNAPERTGLLTRALFLVSGSANTRPIQKGVFIRRRILCDDLPPPPAGANAVPPQLRPDMTTRQVVEELTEKSGTVCTSCHTPFINPLGFATEDFDGLGRLRSEQRLFDSSGKQVGTKPVDTHTTPRIVEGDLTDSSGPADLSKLIAESGKADACLARNYFRFTYARWENLDVDGCTLESLRARLQQGGKIANMLKEVANAPSFKQRAF